MSQSLGSSAGITPMERSGGCAAGSNGSAVKACAAVTTASAVAARTQRKKSMKRGMGWCTQAVRQPRSLGSPPPAAIAIAGVKCKQRLLRF